MCFANHVPLTFTHSVDFTDDGPLTDMIKIIIIIIIIITLGERGKAL